MVILFFTVLIVGVNILIGLKRPVAKNVASIVLLAGSALLSGILARVLATATGSSALSLIQRFSPETYDKLEAGIPSFQSVGSRFAAMILAPLLFVVILLLVRLIFCALHRLLTKLLSAGSFMKKPNIPANLALSAVCGLAVVVLFSVPLVGFGTLAHESVATATKDMDTVTDSESVPAQMKQLDDTYFKPFSESAQVKVIRTLGCRPLFNALTTYKTADGTKMTLREELPAIATVAVNGMGIAGTELADYGETEAGQMRVISTAFGDSAMLRILGSEFASGASAAWLKNETYIGIAKPEVNGFAETVLDGALEMFTDANRDNISGKINAVADIVATCSENGILAAFAEDKSVMDILKMEGTVETVLNSFMESEDTYPLVSALFNASMSLLAEQLGMYETPEAAQEDLDQKLAELSQSGKTVEEVTAEVIRLRDSFAVEWTDEQCAIIAQALLDDPYKEDTQAFLPAQDDEPHLIFTSSFVPVKFDLNNWKAKLQEKLSQKKIQVTQKAIKLVTTKDLKLTKDSIIKIAQKPETKQNFTGGITKLIQSVAELTGTEGASASADAPLKLLSSAGTLLDALDQVPSSGSDDGSDPSGDDKPDGQSLALKLMTGVLQSQKGQELTGLTPAQAKDVAEKVNQNQKAESGSFSATTEQISKLLNLVKSGDAEQLLMDQKQLSETIELIKNMDSASAALLRTVLTAESLEKNGLKKGTATIASTLLINLIDAMVENRGKLTDTQYDAEAKAITSIIYAAAASRNTEISGLFNTNGENNGRLDMTAETFVKTMTDSVIVSQMLEKSQITFEAEYQGEKDPLGLSSILSDSDRTGLSAALDKVTETQKVLDCIRFLFGL